MVSSAMLLGFLLLIRKIFQKKLAAGVLYALWLIPMLRLLIPFGIWEVNMDPFAVFRQWQQPKISQEVILSENRINTIDSQGEILTKEGEIGNEILREDILVSGNEKISQIRENEKENSLEENLYLYIFYGVWIVGSLFFTGFVIKQNLHMKKCFGRLERVGEMGGVPIYIGESVKVPCLMGVRKPKILLNQEIMEKPHLYQCVVEHELAHYHQKDFLWNVCRIFFCIVYWWHPLVWLAAVAVQEDAELACDARVLKGKNLEARRNYGYALLELLENVNEKPSYFYAATSLSGGKKSMKRRIEEISRRTDTKKTVFLPVLLLAVMLLAVGCVAPSNKSWIKGKISDVSYDAVEEASYHQKIYEYRVSDEIKSKLFYYEIYEYGSLTSRRIVAYGNIESTEKQSLEFKLKSGKEKQTLYFTENEGAVTEISILGDSYQDAERTGRSLYFQDSHDKKIVAEKEMILWEDSQGEDKAYYGNLEEMSAEEIEIALKDRERVLLMRAVFSKLSEEELSKKYQAYEVPSNLEATEALNYGEFLHTWAEAFVNRDVETILALSGENAVTKMEESAFLYDENTSFGWSSPWPMFGETLYEILEHRNSGATIRFYASDSTPHLWIWDNDIRIEEINGEFKVTDFSLEDYGKIDTLEIFKREYPNGRVTGTPMDYAKNGLGEILNQNAKDAKESFANLFDPITAAIELLNLPGDGEASYSVEDVTGETTVQIHFEKDGQTAEVVMWQPYGEDGIWIPR